MRTVHGSHGEEWRCEQVDDQHHLVRARTGDARGVAFVFVRCVSPKSWVEIDVPADWERSLSDDALCAEIEHELAAVLGGRGRLLVDHADVAWRVAVDDCPPGLTTTTPIDADGPALLFHSAHGETRRLPNYHRCGVAFAELDEGELLELLRDALPVTEARG